MPASGGFCPYNALDHLIRAPYPLLMKSKNTTEYVCQSCGYDSPKWLGRCPGCNEWNTFVEQRLPKTANKDNSTSYFLTSEKPTPLDEISLEKTPRYTTKIAELDRVLGGGLVPGSLVLLGGDPGIGKSTLVLALLNNLHLNNTSVLYVTGEESKEQIKMRAERLGVKANLMLITENSLENILAHVEKIKPQVLVVDSIQTVYLSSLESAPGSVSQVRESTAKLLYHAKSTMTTTILVGHVTKEGAIAGPRVLEHMVDTVLYFEGENSGQFRIVRAIKNRFGSTNEIGVFEMTAKGLTEITNPSEIFLSSKGAQTIGSCVTAAVEGTRPILAEIQALVSSSQLTNPRRTAIGLDHNRVSLIVAVLEKTTGMNLFNQDIYVNVAGGLKIDEPSTDLAVTLALASSYKNRPLPNHMMVFGEVGLNGELRPVSFAEQRIQEAAKLGYKKIVLPKKVKLGTIPPDIELMTCRTVSEAIDSIL